MSVLSITGGKRLEGRLEVQGSKNSALPLLAASVLTRGEAVFHNCPGLTDVDAAKKILSHLGCRVSGNGTLCVNSQGAVRWDIPHGMMREMRSSIVFLGALLGRFGRAEVSTPGGCEIGLRPIDLHLSALRSMGAAISEQGGRLLCTCPEGLNGAKISLAFPSVGATENIILAAAGARGTTLISNAAREPEIVDLANYLNSCGAKICGAGESIIRIDGVNSLHSCEHTVIADRIVAATYMTAAAVTGGSLVLEKLECAHLEPITAVLEKAGCCVRSGKHSLKITSNGRLNAAGTIRTLPYPGFPTDAQACVMAMLCVARGTSVIIENIFESRFKHISELVRLGASIGVEGRTAVIEGVASLSGAPVVATDLRGGGALVTAGLCARGVTVIDDIFHIERGYENLAENLRSVGAEIVKI